MGTKSSSKNAASTSSSSPSTCDKDSYITFNTTRPKDTISEDNETGNRNKAFLHTEPYFYILKCL